MAGNGDKSGDGKTSPYGPASGGKSGGGVNFVKDPSGNGGGGQGLNVLVTPEGSGNKSGANNFVEKPGGSDMVPGQKTGTHRDPKSVPAGGPTPFVKGGAEPPATRTAPKSGYAAGSAPGGPDRKPFKFTK